jgi:hypothetical protein
MDPNPIQRLAYHNGQRLEAADLRLEQNYHIAVRRLLTSGLFTPGVVSGFEVQRITTNPATGDLDPTHVLVKCGVALDALGREIVLVADQTLAVIPTTLTGYFLTATYAEQSIQAADGWCAPAEPGAAGRTQEGATLAWTDSIPAQCTPDNPSDCGIVLAFVDLDTSCHVTSIILTPRQYAAPTHTSQTQAFALEGEKDIDKDNPKRLNFQIVGGPPQSILLYLWGDQFSTLYYTELGGHEHTVNSAGSGSVNLDWSHTHDLNSHTHKVDLATVSLSDGAPGSPSTDLAGDHIHNLNVGNTNWQVESVPTEGKTQYALRGNQSLPLPGGDGSTYVSSPVLINAGPPTNQHDQHQNPDPPDNLTRDHIHGLSKVVLTATAGGDKVDTEVPAPTFTGSAGSATDTQAITGSTDLTGVPTPQPRTGDAYTFLNDLQVALDGHDITTWILQHLPPTQSLGDGSGPSAAGPIDLLMAAADLQVSLGAGSHSLDFTVPPPSAIVPPCGGKILYNLYVR